MKKCYDGQSAVQRTRHLINRNKIINAERNDMTNYVFEEDLYPSESDKNNQELIDDSQEDLDCGPFSIELNQNLLFLLPKDQQFQQQYILNESLEKIITPSEKIVASHHEVKTIISSNLQSTTLKKELLNLMLTEMIVPIDDSSALCAPDNNKTKGEFARDFKKVITLSKIKVESENNLLELLCAYFPQANFPVKKNGTGKVISNVDQYCQNVDYRTMKFDICFNKGCTIFAAENKTKLRCIEKSCNTHRFRNCTAKKCKFLPYELCEHTFDHRFPYKTLRYRSLILLITELLRTNDFSKVLNYVKLKPKTGMKYWDISDGEQYIQNMSEMEKTFELKYGNETNKEMINIVIGQFYDGCQIYKTKHSSFWPLVVSFLNLPPSYRTKMGVGMFLLGIFTSKMGSAAERFFFSYLYVNELKLLHDGILVDQKWFVQVRLILSCLDTIAVQDHLHVQSVGSLEGCAFCNSGEGIHVPILKKVCHFGHRNILPLKHYLRTRGQSTKCCPENYYSDFKNKFNSFENLLFCPSTKGMRIDIKMKDFQICDKKNRDFVYNFLNSNEGYILYHSIFYGISFDCFDKYLYYEHCDYRPQKIHTRKSNAEYVKNGLHAKSINAPMHGVKNVWPEADLPYVDTEKQVCWDPFHVFGNIALKVLQYFKNERMKPKIVRFCKATHSHPSLYQNDFNKSTSNTAPWSISKLHQSKVRFLKYFIYCFYYYYRIIKLKLIFVSD